MKNITFFLVSSLMLLSCGNRHLFVSEEDRKVVIDPIRPGSKYGFIGDKGTQRIFQSKCRMCHVEGGMNPKDWTDYEVTRDNLELIKKRVFILGDMPMGIKLTDDEKSILKTWIYQGAPYEVDTKSEMTRFNGYVGIPKFFERKCQSCHDDFSIVIDLSEYDEVDDNLSLIDEKIMDKNHVFLLDEMSNQEREQVRSWILGEAPF